MAWQHKPPNALKEYWIVRLNKHEAPTGRVTGPFSSYEQAREALEALKPLYPKRGITIAGGNLFNWKFPGT